MYNFKTFEIPIWNGKQNSLTGPVVTGSFEKRAPGTSEKITGARTKVFASEKFLIIYSTIVNVDRQLSRDNEPILSGHLLQLLFFGGNMFGKSKHNDAKDRK